MWICGLPALVEEVMPCFSQYFCVSGNSTQNRRLIVKCDTVVACGQWHAFLLCCIGHADEIKWHRYRTGSCNGIRVLVFNKRQMVQSPGEAATHKCKLLFQFQNCRFESQLNLPTLFIPIFSSSTGQKPCLILVLID